MNGCRLRAHGSRIDLNHLRCVTPFGPETAIDDEGVTIHIEPKRADCLGTQVAGAVVFLARHHDALVRLASTPGVSTLTLDFSGTVSERTVMPADLVALAGYLGIGLTISPSLSTDQPGTSL